MMELISEQVSAATAARTGPRFERAYPVVCEVNLADTRAFTTGQPYAEFARLRAEAPVCWHEERPPEPGFWVVTRYADVMAVNRDTRTFSSQRGGILLAQGTPETRHPRLFRASLDTMINMDPPWHIQLRREHMPFFTPAYMTSLKSRVVAEVDRLLDEMAGLGSCDLVEHVSAPLPLFTLCEILGVPIGDRPKFLRWMHYLELAGNLAAERQQLSAPPTPQLLSFIEAFNANVDEMFAYGRELLLRRRVDPKPDLLSAIAHARVDGELLRDEYLDGSWLLIVFAGNDTTRNTISGTMKLLTDFPEQKRLLLEHPELLSRAVDEFTRMISPVIYMRRTTACDTELAGQRIGEGEKVVMYYGAANRDDPVFEDPDRLDITRANADKHLAFGYGPHICLGKRVAQIQLEAVYERILARFPEMEYAGGMEIAPNNFVLAIRKLPVRYEARRPLA